MTDHRLSDFQIITLAGCFVLPLDIHQRQHELGGKTMAFVDHNTLREKCGLPPSPGTYVAEFSVDDVHNALSELYERRLVEQGLPSPSHIKMMRMTDRYGMIAAMGLAVGSMCFAAYGVAFVMAKIFGTPGLCP